MSPSCTTTKKRILYDMAATIESGNWQATYTLLDITRAIKEPEVLNNLLWGMFEWVARRMVCAYGLLRDFAAAATPHVKRLAV